MCNVYKFIWNIAWKLDYTFASDLYRSAAWQGALEKGLSVFGNRKVENYIHRPRFELYDLENDPDELVNLAEREEYKGLKDCFIEKIKTFQQSTDDPWLHKWEYE